MELGCAGGFLISVLRDPSLPFGPRSGRTRCQPVPASAILPGRSWPLWLPRAAPAARAVAVGGEAEPSPRKTRSAAQSVIHWTAGAAQTSVQRPGRGELWVRNFLLVNDQLQHWSPGRNCREMAPAAASPGRGRGALPAWGRGGGLLLQVGFRPRLGLSLYSPFFFWAFHQTITICIVIWCLKVAGGRGHWQHPQSSWSESTHGEGRAGSQTLRFPAGLGWAATVSEQHKRRGQRREQLPSRTSLWAGRLLASPFG